MDHLFGAKKGNELLLSKDDERHLLTVLHRQKGDELEVVTEEGLFLGRIEGTSPFSIGVVHPLEPSRELSSHLMVAFALLKNGHDELVLQKCTELGVSAFLPFISQRTIIHLDNKDKEKRIERYRKIVKGASEQSRREIMPSLERIYSFDELLNIEAEHRYLAYEMSEEFSLKNELSSIKEGEKTIVVIGPEGGFTPQEVEKAQNKGWKIISLGKRILRAETASIYFAGIYAYSEEQ